MSDKHCPTCSCRGNIDRLAQECGESRDLVLAVLRASRSDVKNWESHEIEVSAVLSWLPEEIKRQKERMVTVKYG